MRCSRWNRLAQRLLCSSLGDDDARLLMDEMEELHEHRTKVGGKAAADRWRRREVRRALLHGIATRLRRVPRPARSGGPEARYSRRVSSIWKALGGVAQDVRIGLRGLLARPLFTTLAVGTLGLGIGAATIVFSLVDGVLLEEIPYERPGELLNIWKTFPEWQSHEVLGEHWDKIGLTWPEFLVIREHSRHFREIAVRRNRTMILTGSGAPVRLDVGEASTGLFPMLGARPILGRVFLPGEEGPGTARLVVLSHSIWVSRFGSDPGIVGRTVQLDQEPFEVIGVLPPGFRVRSTSFNLLNSTTDTGERALWVPIGFDVLEDGWSLDTMGRLMPGVTTQQIRAELDVLLRGTRTADELGYRLIHPKEEIIGGHRSSLLLLLAASGILLLIACANIAALLMSEIAGRRSEIATRMALGAGRFRIARMVMTESMLIGILGGLLGTALAAVGIPSLLALAPPLPRLEEVGMNHGVLLFSVLAGVGTGGLFGLAPAFLLREGALRFAQGMGGRSITGGHSRLRGSLIAAQLALTMVLLVTGGLFARSLLNLARVDPGFDPGSVATVRAHLPAVALQDPENVRDTFTQLLEQIMTIPGVVQAGAVDELPFPGRASSTQIHIVGSSAEEDRAISTQNHLIVPGYLETMGIPLLAGRTLTEADERDDGPRGMLINEQMARQYWPNESPLGARIRQSRRLYEVVGIVGNVRERHLSEAPEAMVYRVGPFFAQSVSIVARTDSAPADLVARMREAVWAVNPELPVTQESTMTGLVESSTGAERYRSMLVMVFGILASLLASVGIFGVTAHIVSTRSREMGIRMALGAQTRSLIQGVMFKTMLPGVVGIGIGFLGALAVTRLLTGFLFGIEPWDAATFLGVALLLGSLSAAAAVLPAWRVGIVDPMSVLRDE
jgi:putative ABC transport system permease protein